MDWEWPADTECRPATTMLKTRQTPKLQKRNKERRIRRQQAMVASGTRQRVLLAQADAGSTNARQSLNTRHGGLRHIPIEEHMR